MGHADPFFSVIVPTHERPRQLAVCLDALARQNYPRDRFEVLVVDDGSTTSPKTIVDALIGQLNVRLLVQPHSGPAAARNYGATRAAGAFLAFTDDDCAPSPNWLRTFATRFTCLPHCALGGRTINGVPDNPYSSTSQLVVDYLYCHCNPDPGQATFLASNNLALPADRFRELGGFDDTWSYPAGEDRELCDRWISRGHRMVYVPDAVVNHLHPLTWRTFWRQHFNYGRGAFFFRRAAARRHKGSIKTESAWFYLGILCYPLSQARASKALVFAALITGAQVANTAGFFWESTKRSGRE